MAAASVCVVTLSEEPGGELTEQAGCCVVITATVWELTLSHHNSYIKYLKCDAMAKTMTLLNGRSVVEWHHLVSRCETDESKTPVLCNKLSLSACCWCAGFTFSSKYTPIIDLQVTALTNQRKDNWRITTQQDRGQLHQGSVGYKGNIYSYFSAAYGLSDFCSSQ